MRTQYDNNTTKSARRGPTKFSVTGRGMMNRHNQTDDDDDDVNRRKLTCAHTTTPSKIFLTYIHIYK